MDPNATQQAKNLLCYLYSQYGNHVLTGQQETSWGGNPAVDVNWINSTTGKYPAILGADFLYAPNTEGGGAESNNGAAAPSTTASRALAWWNAGGIPLICYHMGAPPNSDSYANSQLSANIANVLTPGTSDYASFIYKLDYAASELQYLQSNNVAVLWRPFHEAGGTWFWWSKGGGAQYVSLWQFMFKYFTQTKGLHNLVWLHPFDGSPPSAFYPGKTYVDVGGADTYATNPPFSSMFGTTRGIDGTTIPIALHETGVMPLGGTMFPTAAPWVLFNTWAGYETNTSFNTAQSVQGVYADSHAVTRDKVPSLK